MVEDRVVLVTGSTTGIGVNIALDLLKSGFRVIVTGRSDAKIDKTIGQIVDDSSCAREQVAGFAADLKDFNQIDELLEFVKKRFGRLDILINNACYRGDLATIIDPILIDQFKDIFHMNVSVPMYLIHKAMKLLKPVGRNQIVINISSVASTIVVPLHGYTVTKACLSEMGRQLSKFSQQLGLDCVTISPGPILTEDRPHHAAMSCLTLLKRVGTTQEISDMVGQCLKNISLFSGQELFIDGGYLAKEYRVKN